VAIPAHLLAGLHALAVSLAAIQAAGADEPSGAGLIEQGVADLAAWLAGLPDVAKAAALGLATFVTEDLTTIFAGLLVADGQLSFWVALIGCTLGIWIGDGLLWLLGRTLGRPALRLPILRSLVQPWQLKRAERWFDKRGLRVVLVSRFLPGSRLPAFFAAGVLGRRAGWFLGWALLAALLWTPLLIGVSVLAAPRIEGWVARLGELQGLWRFLPPLFSLVALVVVLRLMEVAFDWRARRLFVARWKRRTHWEFWPSWVFYAPTFCWYLLLALRHRSLSLPTVSNPAMDAGGFIGESKGAILKDLVAGRDDAQRFVVRTLHLPPGGVERLEQLERWLADEQLDYPIVIKPDAGQRGSGVRYVKTASEARAYLAELPLAVVAQEYAAGPHELGVFYVRPPGEMVGRIFSVTEKFFTTVVGDGEHNLEDLIVRHPRAVLQASTFFRRHADLLGWVPGPGEEFPLVTSGNHAQGALFKDGRRLATDALRARLDALADGYPGFHIGRFDLRAPDLDALIRGEQFKIVELNGATSEATHIYDPDFGPWRGPIEAYRTLFTQWSMVFAISAANRKAGHRPIGTGALIRRLLAARRNLAIHPIAS
jgi:membrane protein DedA with SNARE-associated domain